MQMNDVTDLNALISSKDKNIAYAAIRLQLAILTNMTKHLRSKLPTRKYKLVDGLTREEVRSASVKTDSGNRSGKIQAIKMVRERTDCDLLTAKELVDNWMLRNLGFKDWGVEEK